MNISRGSGDREIETRARAGDSEALGVLAAIDQWIEGMRHARCARCKIGAIYVCRSMLSDINAGVRQACVGCGTNIDQAKDVEAYAVVTPFGHPQDHYAAITLAICPECSSRDDAALKGVALNKVREEHPNARWADHVGHA